MIEDTENGAHGFLLDWEFAVQVNKQHTYEMGGMVCPLSFLLIAWPMITLQGTLPFLSTSLLDQLSNIVGPMESSPTQKSASCTHVNLDSPVMVNHTYADVESLFYIFIWILVLYDGPLGCEHEGIRHENTLLSFWSEEASKNLETAKFAKFTFLVSKRSNLHTQISLYFTDLLPLAESWRTLLGHYVHKEVPMPFEEVFKVFDDFLAKMPDSEKPLAMASTLHKIVEQHSMLSSVLPSRPITKAVVANTKNTNMYPKRLHDEVRSMGNPHVPMKRFKAT